MSTGQVGKPSANAQASQAVARQDAATSTSAAQAAPARAAAASQGEVHSGATAQGVLDMCTNLHDRAHEAVADLLTHQCCLHVDRSLVKTALSLKHLLALFGQEQTACEYM